MKLFPFSLIRLSGLPFPDLNQQLQAAYNEIEISRKDLKDSQANLVSILLNLKGDSNDYSYKKTISNLIIDIRSSRNIDKEKNYSLLGELTEPLVEFQSAKKRLSNQIEQFEERYNSVRLDFRKVIQQDLARDEIKSSIALSNLSASKRIQKYIQDQSGSINKKSRQSELVALKYWTRASTKTSPFAGLGPLSWVNSFQESLQILKVNQVLLVYLEEFLLAQEWGFKKIAFGLNPCIQNKAEVFEYLVNERNIETIKVIEKQGLLELLVSDLSEYQLSISQWMEKLMEFIEADKETIYNFLVQLQQQGFILPIFPCHREDTNWIAKWTSYIADSFPEQKQLVILLKLCKALECESKISLDRMMMLHQLWKEFLGDEFDLSAERLFYRDDYWKLDQTLDINQENSWIKAIEPYLPRLSKYTFSKQQCAIRKVFDSLEIKEIGLLDFYQVFHRTKGIDIQSEIKEFNNQQEEWIKSLEGLEFECTNDLLKIDRSLLNEILPEAEVEYSESWYGSIIQKGEDLPYLRSIFTGHGKMMSRFIQDEKISELIQNWNNSFSKLTIVDHSDKSAFNANLHPTLSTSHLATVYPFRNQQSESSIDLKDLVIREKGADLILWSRSKNIQILPINYGLEGLDRRSPLYQLIQNFGSRKPDFSPLKKAIRRQVNITESWGVRYPRIQLMDEVIIGRKTWVINQESIPRKEKGQTEANYFLLLVDAFNSMGIPTAGFMTRMQNIESSTIRGIHKPQYFDLMQPIYCALFHQMIQKSKGSIQWEEVYPSPSKNHPFPSHAQEWVVEWMT